MSPMTDKFDLLIPRRTATGCPSAHAGAGPQGRSPPRLLPPRPRLAGVGSHRAGSGAGGAGHHGWPITMLVLRPWRDHGRIVDEMIASPEGEPEVMDPGTSRGAGLCCR